MKQGSLVARLISQSGKGDPIQVTRRNPSTKRSKDFGVLKSLLASKENHHKSTTNLLGSAKPKDGPNTVKTGRTGSTSKDKIEKRKLRKVVSQSIATEMKPKIAVKPIVKKDRREPLSMDQFRPKKGIKTQHSFKQSQQSLATDEKLHLNTSTTSMFPRDTEKFPNIPHSPMARTTTQQFQGTYNHAKAVQSTKGASKPSTQEPLVPTVRLSMSIPHPPPQRQTEFVCKLSAEEKAKWVDDYITAGHQPALKHKMRIILVDWLSAVSHDLGLVRDTFYLAVAVLDRFLAKHRLESVKELQLLGLVALSLACKMEEVFPPSIGKLLGFCLNAYTLEQYEALELVVCKVSFTTHKDTELEHPNHHSVHLDRSANLCMGPLPRESAFSGLFPLRTTRRRTFQDPRPEKLQTVGLF